MERDTILINKVLCSPLRKKGKKANLLKKKNEKDVKIIKFDYFN
jgi:hypothetical protein